MSNVVRPSNPIENRLPSGISAEQLEKAVRASGYPLQRVVAEQLSAEFTVTEEWGFIDRESREHRGLDVFARKLLDEKPSLSINLALLIECKRSDAPYVFFRAAAPEVPFDFPRVAGLRGKDPEIHQEGYGSTSTSVAQLLKLDDCDFVGRGPIMCSAFSRAERKGRDLDLSGSVIFNKVIMPLSSAMSHFQRVQAQVYGNNRVPIYLALCVCVLDAPMLSVEGSPETPQIELNPWIRVVRQEAVQLEPRLRRLQHYVVDFVHRAFVAIFLRDHLLPFAAQFAKRAATLERVLADGKAAVPSLTTWRFEDVRPVRGQ